MIPNIIYDLLFFLFLSIKCAIIIVTNNKPITNKLIPFIIFTPITSFFSISLSYCSRQSNNNLRFLKLFEGIILVPGGYPSNRGRCVCHNDKIYYNLYFFIFFIFFIFYFLLFCRSASYPSSPLYKKIDLIFFI